MLLRTPLLAAVATAAVLAGCLNGTTPSAADAPSILTDYLYYLDEDFPLDLDHDHSDPTLHEANFQVDFVAHHACTEGGDYAAGTVGGFTDIAFWDHYAFVGKRNGFCILDVSDPTAPKFVSHYLGEGAADMEVSPDGNFAILLTQRNGAPGPLQAGSTDPTDNLPRGAIVVNVKDKKNPQFESYYQVLTNGVHTATVGEVDGRTVVAIQTYDWVPPGGLPAAGVPQQNAPATQRVEITELRADPTGRVGLQFLGRYSLNRPGAEQLAMWFPHDAFIQKHPMTGKTYLYVAYWDAGLVILDISMPSSPQVVSRYSDLAPSKYNQYHDVKVSPDLIDGRHITVTGPELESAAGEVGYFRIFDTTDPAKPVQLGAWTLPGVSGFSGGFQFSPHVFQVVNGRIYLAHNHGGIWVVDIHNETLLRAPQAAGYYFPHGDEASPESWANSASVWGAYVKDGYIYATEGTQGVHVLHWAADETEMVTDEAMAHMH